MEYYRFNLSLPMDVKKYIQEAAWASRMSTTAYLVSLIRRDMLEHPEVIQVEQGGRNQKTRSCV